MCLLKRFILLVSLLVSFGVAGAVPDAVPEGLNRILKNFKTGLKGLSLYVSRVDQVSPWVTYQSRVPRNPGSVVKLLTAASALEKLGPAFTWKTEFYADKPPKDGHLRGPLYLKGYGDPYITVERFWTAVQELRNAGIKHIHGDVVLDARYFRRSTVPADAFDGKGNRAYNVQPYALLVNFQSVRLRLSPGRKSVEVQAYPKVATLKIDNRLRLVKGRCGAWKYRIKIDSVARPRQESLVLTGRYARGCGVKYMYRAVQDPANYTAGLFISLWRQQGGTIKGTFRNGRVPKAAKLLYSAPSLPLADIIRRINKYSNNVMTRHVLLTVIAKSLSIPALESKGEQVVRQWLQQQKIPASGFRLENSAGLSRATRISALQLGRALKTVYRKSYMPELVSSLPIAGVDGTMADRRLTKASHGKMHLKTGLLDNVRSIAGYYLSPKGHRYVVVILHNHPVAHTRRGKQLQNRVLNWLYLHSP